MNCESCKGHTPDLDEATAAVKKASEITQVYDRQNRRLWIVVIVLAGCMMVMAGCMVWQTMHLQRIVTESIQKSQDAFNEAMLEALNTVAEMEVISETTTTTTTEVIQDTGEGSGNNVYLDGDGTTYNEGGGS